MTTYTADDFIPNRYEESAAGRATHLQRVATVCAPLARKLLILLGSRGDLEREGLEPSTPAL
jgi:hypothetical protein